MLFIKAINQTRKTHICTASLGFAGKKKINELENFLKELHLDRKKIISRCQEVAIRTSFYIYCHHSKEWTDLDLMSYT